MPGKGGFELVERLPLGRIPVVMLITAAHPDHMSHCRDLGLSGCLMKPVKRKALRAALANAFGNSPSPSETPRKRVSGTLRALADNISLIESRDILLAEDNAVNQKLATRILEKYGHRVTVTSNGEEACAAFEERTFDLVLMDVQMPELDGLEATVRIRDFERRQGVLRTPIIAMTAHAMSEDRMRCLDAGMDEYLSKPIQSADLLRLIEDCCPPRKSTGERVTISAR
jgi:two-component system, sensor histidine kinase and response regulator